MRLCAAHFAELRAKLEKEGRGLVAAYSSRSHDDVLRRYEAEGYILERIGNTGVTLEHFDGAMVAYGRILELAADACGVDSERMKAIALNAICPACSFVEVAKRDAWLDEGAYAAGALFDRLIGGTA